MQRKARAPKAPDAPSHDELSKLIGDITVNCTNSAATHAPKSKGYALMTDSYTPGTVVANTDGGYTYAVTIKSEKYVNQFDADTGAAHTPKDGKATVELEYKDKAWAVKSGKPVSFDVACVTEIVPPEKPVPADLGSFIKVICTTKKDVHGTAIYPLHEGKYTIGEVEGNAKDGYTCTITIEAARYVAAYSNAKGEEHTLVRENDASKTVTLTWDSEAKDWSRPDDVTFEVMCSTEIVPPTKPTLDDLRKLLGPVTVDCTNANANHPDGKYDLIEDSYIANIEDQNGTYVCMVSVYADKYVAKYNETYSGHSLAGSANSDKVKLVYLRATKTNTGYTPWSVSEAEPLTFAVKCSTEIDPSKKPTLEQLPEISVTLHCGTTSAHRDPTWSPLLENTYEISTPTLKNDVYTCTLTIKAEKYVDEYSGTVYRVGKHELDDDATKDITLTWKDGKWTAETSSVTFNVKCALYTVIYTDGVKNKVIFKDELHENLAYGSDTPKFTGGTPKRTGYTFTGWSPKVADTVTGNVTYKAQWKSNSGKDNVPKTGDGGIVMILGSILLFSFCGAAAVCVFNRKKKQG